MCAEIGRGLQDDNVFNTNKLQWGVNSNVQTDYPFIIPFSVQVFMQAFLVAGIWIWWLVCLMPFVIAGPSTSLTDGFSGCWPLCRPLWVPLCGHFCGPLCGHLWVNIWGNIWRNIWGNIWGNICGPLWVEIQTTFT